MTWRIELAESARKQIHKLDKPNQKELAGFLRKLEEVDDPRRIGKALQGDHAGLWRYRAGDYRVVCQIKDTVLIILVVKIGHRKEVYRKRP